MALKVATHSGSFHADDVLAFSLIRVFVDPDATIERTRNPERWATADVVIDVGGEFDPTRMRFDHHQANYTGTRSSAGMVLDWLETESKVTKVVAQSLRHDLVEHVDAIDTGSKTPTRGVPCFSTLVAMTNNTAKSPEDFLANYLEAARMAARVVEGIVAGCEQIAAAREAVETGMADAIANNRAVIFLDDYYVWKPAYFENDGINHPTDFVLFPGDNNWRIVAIPPELGSYDNKRPLPLEWAGLTDESLTAVVGVPGASFCHKNRFIAVFKTRQGALDALEKWDLMRRP
jgi:uncharacterized UPF0160 family protein